MALGDIWASLNDKCWPILDALHLSDIFEKYRIPPIVFPLAIIVLILALLMMMGGPAAPAPTCGDGMCSPPEDATSCEQDCKIIEEVEGNRVTVQLDTSPSCRITISLYSSTGEFLGRQDGQKRQFTFEGIKASSASATLQGPYEKKQETSSISLEDDATIDVTFDTSLCATQSAGMTTLRFVVKDSLTNAEINGASVSIAETENSQPVAYRFQDYTVNGHYDFNVPGGKTYIIYASKDGYIASQETVYIEQGKTTSKTMSLAPLQPSGGEPGATTGDVEVCVRSASGDITTGFVTLTDSAGNMLVEGDLSDPGDAETTFPGCYVFENLPAGTMVSASMPRAPAGCAPGVAEPVTGIIDSAARLLFMVNLDCSSAMGYLKIKLIDRQGNIMTENATITLWTEDAELIPGTGIANSLAAESGGYTEEVTVPSNTPLYIWARGLPLGYLDYKSQMINVSVGQHRSVTLTLNYSEQAMPSNNFTFLGVSSPDDITMSQSFLATASDVLYGETVLTEDNSEVTASIGENECNVSRIGSWQFDCVAPDSVGEYNLVITAVYGSYTESYSLPLNVIYGTGIGLITIKPVFATHSEPPVKLYYDITLNGKKVKSLYGQSLELSYSDSPGAYSGNASRLTLDVSNGYWYTTADVPYKGDYRLKMTISVLDAGVIYNSTYNAGFTSDANSNKLKADVRISKQVVPIGESFKVDVSLTFGKQVASGLKIFQLYMDEVFHTFIWNENEQMYKLSLAAPAREICTTRMRFIIKDAEVVEPMTIHVLDLSKPKSATCPLDVQGSCSDIESARKCADNYFAGTAFYKSEEIAACIASGCPSSLLFKCPSQNKGDLNDDCVVNSDDTTVMDEFMTAVNSASGRNALSGCMDMDNDGDVDDNDSECLKNLAATKWYGDVGEGGVAGSCTKQMKGGFCFDICTTSRVPGDLDCNGNILEEDVTIMMKAIEAASAGVTPHAEMLRVADFNRDGALTSVDLECQRAFMGIDFETGDILQADIPDECMAIFDLRCGPSKGDLNGDGKLDEFDLLVMKLIVGGHISAPSELTTCADINNDGAITEEDLLCLEAYFSGETDRWLACLDCDKNLPLDAYNVYEICNDGYDNNCDGVTDEEEPGCSECSELTQCELIWDDDSGTTPGIEDGLYTVCAKPSWESTEAPGSSSGEYRLLEPSELEEHCSADEWKNVNTYQCANSTGDAVTYYCNFMYPTGFAYPANPAADDMEFAWKPWRNTGPAGVLRECREGLPECATGWNKIVNARSICCKHCNEPGATKHHETCSTCRFAYDFCQQQECDQSHGRCWYDTSETCPVRHDEEEGLCMGNYTGS